MQIKIAVEPLNDGFSISEHKSIQVTTAIRRGDSWLNQKVDTVMADGKDVVFIVPDGAKLYIDTPMAYEEVIYDAGQGATIRRSQQDNEHGRADRAGERLDPKPYAGPLDAQGQTVSHDDLLVGSQGADSRTAAERAAGQPNYVPPPGQGGRITPANPPPGTPPVRLGSNPSTPPTSGQTVSAPPASPLTNTDKPGDADKDKK